MRAHDDVLPGEREGQLARDVEPEREEDFPSRRRQHQCRRSAGAAGSLDDHW